MIKKIFISAGEVSGDFQGSLLVEKLKAKDPSIIVMAIGGEKMSKAGAEVLWDFTQLSSIGVVESLLPAFKILLQLRKIRKFLKENTFDVIIFIDNQGFNLSLARFTKKLNMKSIYYFPPQVSIWGKWNAKKLKNLVDKILCPFYADYKIYNSVGATASFVGHPLVNLIDDMISKAHPAKSDQITRFTIGLFPGSRVQEINHLLPIMLEAAVLIRKHYSVQFILPLSSSKFNPLINKLIEKYKELQIQFIHQGDYHHYRLCDFALTASGTVTLELALLGVPMLVTYKVHFITYFLAKFFMSKKRISLPNILLDDDCVPELLQKDVSKEKIFDITNHYLKQGDKRKELKKKLIKVKGLLGGGNSLDLVVKEIFSTH